MANSLPVPHCRKSPARSFAPTSFPVRTAALAAFGLLLTACSSGSDPAPPPPPPTGPSGPVSIKQFTGENACIELEAKIESTVVQMMRQQIKNIRRYPYADAGGGLVNSPSTGGDAVSAPTSPAPESENRYSETNVQVGGVDELDPVKNDGTSLYSLTSDGTEIVFTHAALRPAMDMRVIGQNRWPVAPGDTRLPHEQPIGLFRIDDSNVAALTSSRNYFAYPAIDVVGPGVAVASDSICIDTGCGPVPRWQPPRTHLRVFGTSSDAAPVKNWQISLAGQLIEARRIDRKIYLVSQATLQMPEQVRWWPDVPYDSTEGRWQAALADLLARNSQIISDTTLAQWLAPLSDQYDPDTAPPVPTAAQCSEYSTIDASSRLGWLRVSTVDLDARSVTHQTVLAQGSAVYMSANSLIVSTQFWEPFTEGDVVDPGVGAPILVRPTSKTFLHRFALNDQGQARYTSSGTIDGRLINRFAIDEATDGLVRVAASSRSNGQSISYLATLKEQGKELVVQGRSADIAPGETLRSARFVKDRAYLVTAVVIDPFFVFDMSDPSAPRELGQLKIPGFSSYLHPVGDNHVLGIGYDDTGWPRRIKASLFNVTDPANPLEQAVLNLGNTYTGSAALWDPHAFTLYYPNESSTEAVMAIPVRSYRRVEYGTGEESGIRLVSVKPDSGGLALSLRGTLDMSDLLNVSASINGWRSTDPRRAVFVEQTAYGISDAAVRAVNLSDPATEVGTLMIP